MRGPGKLLVVLTLGLLAAGLTGLALRKPARPVHGKLRVAWQAHIPFKSTTGSGFAWVEGLPQGGVVLVASPGELFWIDAQGRIFAQERLAGEVYSEPISAQGIVLATSTGNVRKYTFDGKLEWSTDLRGTDAKLHSGPNNCYFALSNGTTPGRPDLSILDSSGKLLRQAKLSALGGYYGFEVAEDGSLYCASFSDNRAVEGHAIEHYGADGKLRWRLKVASAEVPSIWSAPGSGCYVLTDTELALLRPDSSCAWKLHRSRLLTGPTLDRWDTIIGTLEGDVLVYSGNGPARVSKDGKVMWVQSAGSLNTPEISALGDTYCIDRQADRPSLIEMLLKRIGLAPLPATTETIEIKQFDADGGLVGTWDRTVKTMGSIQGPFEKGVFYGLTGTGFLPDLLTRYELDPSN